LSLPWRLCAPSHHQPPLVAEELGISVAAVWLTKFRVLKGLRQEIKKLIGGAHIYLIGLAAKRTT
jgi:hypothetical protein